MELGGQLPAFRKRGLEVAAVSYDSPDVLRHFAATRHVAFPLLADPSSEVIRRFGLAQDNGAAYATTFVTDAQGLVRARYTEDSIVFRRTGGSLLVAAGARPDGAQAVPTDHFTLVTSSSNDVVGPGQRFTLVLDFEVEDGHHLYAPGVTGGYRALSVRLGPPPRVLRIDAPRFPEARPYLYRPLNETVPIFEGRFRVTVDVTMNDTNVGWAQDRLDDPARYEPVELRGDLGYQVCSHTKCYPPATLPLRFDVRLRPKDERRAPVEMRKPR